MKRKVFKVGVAGTFVLALCCFTPLLVVVLSAIGLSAAIGWLDYVLMPALIIFLALMVYGFIARNKSGGS